MEFPLLIEELGQQSSLEGLRLDSEGCCSVLFDDQHEVEFQWDQETNTVLFWCTVGELSSLTEPLARLLLNGSVFGSATDGAAFGIFEPLDAIILWQRAPGGFEDLTDFTSAINRFLAQCSFWKSKIREELQQADVPPEIAPFPPL